VFKEAKNAVVDVRVKRGVEIGSYHHLLIMKLDESKMGGSKGRGWRRNRWRLRVEKLRKDEGQAAFQRKLEEKWVDDNYGTVEEEWIAKKKWIMEAAEEAVGKKRCGGMGKRWWGEELDMLVQVKKAAYKKWLNSRKDEDKKEYREICKQVKVEVEEAKQKAWERFGKKAQEAFYNNNKVFWKMIKGEAKSQQIILKNQRGDLIDGGKEVAEWCRKYFQELYNDGHREEILTAPPGQKEESEWAKELSQEPTEREVREGVKGLKNGKAAGNSEILGEMLKAGGKIMERWLVNFLRKVWRE